MTDPISLQNLSKVYRTPSIIPWKRQRRIHALREVSFSCPPSRISCLLGPNGAGKTTVLKILSGLVLPDSGEARVFGIPLHRQSLDERSRISLVSPNERSFYWRLTGRQNLEFFAALHGLKGSKRKIRVSEVLSSVELEEESDKPFRLYSGGMKQKLLIARALLSEPEILLLDEPTIHLDPATKTGIHRLIREQLLEEMGGTVLLCTHDLYEAEELSDHLILLNEGKVLAEGTLASLRSRVRQPRFVIEFERLPRHGWDKGLHLIHAREYGRQLEFSVQDSSVVPDVVTAFISGGGRIINCHTREESLAEVFSRITSEDGS